MCVCVVCELVNGSGTARCKRLVDPVETIAGRVKQESVSEDQSRVVEVTYKKAND